MQPAPRLQRCPIGPRWPWGWSGGRGWCCWRRRASRWIEAPVRLAFRVPWCGPGLTATGRAASPAGRTVRARVGRGRLPPAAPPRCWPPAPPAPARSPASRRGGSARSRPAPSWSTSLRPSPPRSPRSTCALTTSRSSTASWSANGAPLIPAASPSSPPSTVPGCTRSSKGAAASAVNASGHRPWPTWPLSSVPCISAWNPIAPPCRWTVHSCETILAKVDAARASTTPLGADAA
jgi:hypothetical protein